MKGPPAPGQAQHRFCRGSRSGRRWRPVKPRADRAWSGAAFSVYGAVGLDGHARRHRRGAVTNLLPATRLARADAAGDRLLPGRRLDRRPWSRQNLAAYAGVRESSSGGGFGGVALAHNVRCRAEATKSSTPRSRRVGKSRAFLPRPSTAAMRDTSATRTATSGRSPGTPASRCATTAPSRCPTLQRSRRCLRCHSALSATSASAASCSRR